MLIRFTVKNFLSFKNDTEFSMIPDQGTKRNRHIIPAEGTSGIPLLQSGIIYGANAAGKSNLFKAINAARQIIIKPVEMGKPLPDLRFKLDPKCKTTHTTFEFEIRVGKKSYAYGFSFTPKEVTEEWLYRMGKSKDTLIFKRKKLAVQIAKNLPAKSKQEIKRLSFIADDLFPNQLFLTMANNRNIAALKTAAPLIAVFDWFKTSLTLLFPNTKYYGMPIFGGEHNLSDVFDKILSGFDTGIRRTSFIEIPLERFYKKVPKPVIEDIKSSLTSESKILLSGDDYDTFLLSADDEHNLAVKELVTYHDNSDVYFEMSEESDGTKRLTDLLPLFVNFFSGRQTVIFIDELDRSLHTELSYKFMELFFEFAEKRAIQCVISTHDTALLELKLFRKDEIWFAEKNKSGESKIYSLAQFKPRDDLKLSKGYLNGRFGAIPFFGNNLESFVKSLRSNGYGA